LNLQTIDGIDLRILEQYEEKTCATGFLLRFNVSKTALKRIAKAYNHWIITFSGGKDSTTTLITALETALELGDEIERLDVVYADTRVEIPVMQQYALTFVQFLQKFDRVRSLPLHCHVVYPTTEESFWVCLLGKGYPPPHQRFRWCTRRLKIEPVEHALKSFVRPDRTAILTGVRFGESQARDAGLYQSCRRGGECGQGVWFEYSSRLQAAYVAPIVDWKECDVWDFLNFYAPILGYPTDHLEGILYNGRETRFGCWMCTVVKQDKAMMKITSLPEWSHLKPLLDFRQRVKELTAHIDSRVLRPNGKPGRLTLQVRKQLLGELIDLQEKLGMSLISDEEVKAINLLWCNGKYS